MRGHSKHGAHHTGTHRQTRKHGGHHPHKGVKGPHPGARGKPHPHHKR